MNNKQDDMFEQLHQLAQKARKMGFAVVIYTPDEVAQMTNTAAGLESFMVQEANDAFGD